MALGQLLVELGLNSVAFKNGCDKATYMGKALANDLKKSFKEVSDNFAELGTMLSGGLGPLSGVISGISRGFETVGASIKAAGNGAPGLLAVAGAAGGIALAAGAAAVGLIEMAKGGADAVEQLDLISVKTGISIRDLQTLKAAGDTVNIPIEQMAMGFRRFSRALADSGDPTKRTSEILKTLGVSSRDPYEAFLQLADGISKIEDPNKRAAMATALLGQRIAQGLLPELEKGREGILKYKLMVDEYGASIGPEQVENQKKYKDSLEEMSLSWDRVKIGAAGVLPYMTKFNDALAFLIAHPMNALTFKGDAGLEGGVGPAVTAAEKAQKKKIEDSEDAAAAALKEYQNIKAGGVAAQALANAQQHIKDLLVENTAESNHQAAIEEAKIPVLEKQAALEKEKREALLSLPQSTKKAVDSQDQKVVSEYAAAIKALGPEHAEEARQLEVEGEVQKFVNEQREKGISTYTAAKAAAQQYRDAVSMVTLATTELGKATETGKLIEEFTQKTKAATKAADEMEGKHGELAKVEATLRDGLDKSMKSLVAETAAYNAHKSAVDADTSATQDEKDAVAREAAIVEEHVAAINTQTVALDALIAKRKQAKVEEKDDDRQRGYEETAAYIQLLNEMPDAEAKAVMGLEKDAEALFGVGAEAKAARDAYVKLHEEQARQSVGQNEKKEAATKGRETVESPVNDMRGLEDQKKFLMDNAAEWSKNTLSAAAYQKELISISLQELQLKAAAGSMSAGLKAGFTQMVLETKTLGQDIQENIVKAFGQMNKAIAQSVVEGKNLGKAMKSIAKGIAEDMIEAGLKILEKWIIQHTLMSALTKASATSDAAAQTAANSAMALSAAGLAGANGVASFAAAPWPIDMGAPAFGGAMFAEAMTFAAFEQGGIVPETGLALVHEKEMVLPRPIAEKVQNMADPKQGGGGARQTTVNMTVNTPNADSFKMSQNQINAKAHQAAAKNSRRNGG